MTVGVHLNKLKQGIVVLGMFMGQVLAKLPDFRIPGILGIVSAPADGPFLGSQAVLDIIYFPLGQAKLSLHNILLLEKSLV
jgi:hypothetical protein